MRAIAYASSVAAAFVSFFAAPLAAQTDAPQIEGTADEAQVVPPAFSQFLDSVDSFRARFVQELWSDDQRLIDVAEGDVELLRPGRFHWHYEAPFEQYVIADGKTLWMYDVDLSQVTRSALDTNAPGNPGALLSGGEGVLDSFEIVGSGSEDGEVWVQLAPLSLQSDYSSVRVAFSDDDAGVLRELEFVDGLNQTTIIHFQNAEVNPDIAQERFSFEVPDGVHVFGGPG